MARRSRLPITRLSLAALSLTATCAGVGFAPTPAAADVRGQINAAKQKLAALDSQAEAASERYNAARIKLAGDQRAAQAASDRLVVAQRALGALRATITGFAVAAYQGEALATTSLGVTADSPQAYLDKIATLDAVSNSQQQALARYAAAQRAQEQAQANARAALDAQRTATAQMKSDRAQVVAAAHQEQHILAQLQAKERAIIRAARARAARIAAQRAAAALAARQAAAAAAARAIVSQPVTPPVVHGSGGASVAVQWAYNELGKPYVWGAAGPNSFDCSGLTQYVWAKAGVYLDHYTGSQWNEGQHVAESQLQPGDLVFFYAGHDHVGIYVGGGNFIQAPHTGTVVQVTSLSGYYQANFVGAVRPGT